MYCFQTLFLLFGLLAQAHDLYLVQLKSEHHKLLKRDSSALHFKDFLAIAQKYDGNPFVESEQSQIMYEYNFNDFLGFAIKTSPEAIEEISADPRVASWSVDNPLEFFSSGDNATVAKLPQWGADRIDQRSLPLDGRFKDFEGKGEGVTVFILDSGIDSTHPELEERATVGPRFEDETTNSDDFGHGTHLAGIIASKSFGIAPKANVVGIKVIHESELVAALQYVVENATPGKAVINLSVGTNPERCRKRPKRCLNKIINAAVRAVVKSTLHPGKTRKFNVAAAGNHGENACDLSPAGEPMAYTVASSTKRDEFDKDFSNNGPCVDIIAPGTRIYSTWTKGTYRMMSGTSMAAPHVAGVFAVKLSAKSYTNVQALYDEITELSVKDVIKNVPANTVNRLLYIE